VLGELAFEDATALARLLRERALSSVELTQAAIERIEALNPSLNAVVTPMFDSALERAACVDVSPADSHPAPFAGVPFLVKDLIATCAGVRQTDGSRFCSDRLAERDSPLVRRLRAAGLVLVGKTNTSELGSTPVTENGLFGATRNPWDTSLSPAGSSGGSAAAVAAGIVPMAHGNDMGGSLRNPASCCGVFGFKPSRGRMPLEADHGELLSRLLVEHALTRSVRDSAALLDATHGALPGDPHRAPTPGQPFASALQGPLRRLTIACSTDTPTGERPDAQCVAAVQRAAALCEQLGHRVVEAQPQLDGDALVRGWFEIWAHTIGGMVEDLGARTGTPPRPECFQVLTWRWYERSRERSARDYLQAARSLARCAASIAELLEEHDAWLTPTLGMPAIPVGAFDGGPGDDISKYMGFSPFARLANISGCPAMSVPLHWTGEGIPVGAHFIGRLWDEHTLLALAAQLEEAAPWSGRRPPVSCAPRASPEPIGSTPSSSRSAKNARP
jgi:amidase